MEQVLHNKPHGNVMKKHDNNDKNQCQLAATDDRVSQRTTRRGWGKRRRGSGGATLAAAAVAKQVAPTNDNDTQLTSAAGRAHIFSGESGATGGRTMNGFGHRMCSSSTADLIVVAAAAATASERAKPTAIVAQHLPLIVDRKTPCRRSALVNSATDRHTPRLSWPTLMGLAIVIAIVSTMTSMSFVRGAHLATSYEDAGRPYLDTSCESRRKDATTSEAARILLMLKCDVKPLYQQYVAAYGADAAKTIGGKPRIGRDLARLAQVVDDFAEEGFTLLGVTDFCTFHTVSRLRNLKNKAAESNLLSIAYDTIAIEFHRSCLKEIISKLPPIPNLVRDVIKIYIQGVNQKLVRPTKSRGTSLSMDDYDDVAPFDVDDAVRRNGKLEHIVGLLLTMPLGEPKSDEEIADDFRKQCRQFLVEIERRWDTGEMMSSMLTTEGNAIKSVNNYVMRTLTPTKFADICSQLSEPSRG